MSDSNKIFEIATKSKISKARTGKLTLAHGQIQTPVFMTIGTAGSVKSLDYQDLIKLNAEIILGNTYHLWLRPGMEVMEQAGGLHNFMHWDRPILTDSGGFQAFSLSKIRKFSDEGVFFDSQVDGQKRFLSPEISMSIQTILGSDIALVLDECLPAEVTEETAKSAMKRTFQWAKRSKLAFEKLKTESISSMNLSQLETAQLNYSLKKMPLAREARRSQRGQHGLAEYNSQNTFPELSKYLEVTQHPISKDRYLFGIPQGAQFVNLRKESAKMTMELDFPGYSIGGVANGGEPEEIMYQQVLAQTEILEENKPRHLLGVGTPKDIIEMVKRGIDMFDCVYPTRNARHGSLHLWTDYENLEYETIKIRSSRFAKDFSAINSNSNLPELKNYTKSYLHHLFKANELLGLRLATLHNLEFYYSLMAKIREKIEEGVF